MTGKADAVRAVSQQFKDRTNTVIEGIMAHLRDDNAKEILGPGLSPLIGRGSLKSLVTFALYADVLRMVRDMVMADGEISDEEVQESLGLLSVLAAGFAKVRKEYAAFTQLTLETARQFLSQYASDAGLFGYANAGTQWAGLQVCRHVQSTCGDDGPINAFRASLVSWAEVIAGSDAMSEQEKQQLEALRQLCSDATSAVGPASLAADSGPLNPTDLLTAEIINSDPHASKSHFTHIEDAAADLLKSADYPLVLNSIVTVSPHAAACLGSHTGGKLELNAVREISDDVAAGLSTRTKVFSLDGVDRLTDGSAMHLSQCAAKLSLRGLKELADTPGHLALAAKLATQSGDLVLDSLGRIGPRVAAALSQHSGRLCLRGLKNIDDTGLASLLTRSDATEIASDLIRSLFARGKGQLVKLYVTERSGDLGVMQSLSADQCDADAVRALVEADRDLSFDTLLSISPEVAAVLAAIPRDITIGRLVSLTDETAAALQGHAGALTIGYIDNVSVEAAQSLVSHVGTLAIDDIDDLPAEVRAVLATRLEVNGGLASYVEQACELLGTVQGLANYHPADLRDVDFNQLAAMAGDLIQKLRDAEHVGGPAAESTYSVLERLQELADQDLADLADVDLQQLADDAEAAALGLQSGSSGEVEGKVMEGEVLTKEVAEQFVADSDAVDLNTFTAIADNAAALLANHKFEVFGAYLSLDGLKSLSASSAAALASHDGDLSLCGLETLSPEIAAALAKHTHRLQLGGLATLSDEAAEALALHRPTSVRFRLQTKPTLSVGGYNGECEMTPRGLRALAMYSGCIELSCDFSDNSEEPEWAEPLRIFQARQDQRLFKSFSSTIWEALEQKDVGDLRDLADWTFSEAHGKSPWEVFDEFKDLMRACGNRTVWLHVLDEDDEPKPFYLFLGDEDALVRRIETLPDKT